MLFFYIENKKNKGFTLIELLVVIAIIGILSVVVLASLNSTRSKAKDAAIKQSTTQLSNLMALNYSDYGSYCNLQSGLVWISNTTQCDAAFVGTYAQKARDICTTLFNNSGVSDQIGQMLIYLGGAPNNCSKDYSWSIKLNNSSKWFCQGSGGKGENSNYYSGPGCYFNP